MSFSTSPSQQDGPAAPSTPAMRWFYLATAAFLLLRWLIVPALPFGNDEAYYWDWGRELALSYFDHPPGVSWLAHLGNLIDSSPRSARLVVPLFHAVGALLQLQLLRRIVAPKAPTTSQLITLFILSQLVPYSFVGGLLLMPDAGLLVWLPLLALILLTLSETGPDADLPNVQMMALGLVLGLAFNFKYHGLVMGGCGILWLLAVRGLGQRRFLSHFDAELKSWLLAFGGFCLAAFPVLYWNISNDFVSFKFQSDHGFGGLEFRLTPLVQLLVAEIVLLTPLTIYLLARSLRMMAQLKPSLFAAMALPLLVLILALAPFKEVLPHWLVPCFWLLLPLLAIPAISRVWQSGTAVYSAILVALLLLVTINPAVQQFAFSQTRNKPSGLGELTVWPYVAKELAARDVLAPAHFADSAAPGGQSCGLPPEQLPVIASVRWYWVAQLAAELPNQPKVISLDPDHLSYYHFRDDLAAYSGCPVVVIGQTKHTSVDKLSTGPSAKIAPIKDEVFIPEFHRDRETLLVWGYLR